MFLSKLKFILFHASNKDSFSSHFDFGAETKQEPVMHLLGIILSFCLVGFLVTFVYIVLSKILKRDFLTSTDIESDACKNNINLFIFKIILQLWRLDGNSLELKH